MAEAIPVLFTTDLVGLGGGEVHLRLHLEHLDRGKYRPLLLCPTYGPLVESALKADVRVEMMSLGTLRLYGGMVPYIPVRSVWDICKLMKRHRIGLVHANSFSTMAVASVAAKLLRLPVIWTCHGWWPARMLTGFYVTRLVDRVIAVSQAVREKLVGPGFVNPAAVEVVHPGIQWEGYQNPSRRSAVRGEFGIETHAPLVGMVGRFQAIKGHQTFIRCAAIVKEKLPGARFVIVGARVFDRKGDERYEEEVSRLIKEAGLEEEVLLTGFREDVPSIMSALDVLVVPSLMETFGMVAVEGMASGIPVVASRVGGLRETVVNEVTGFLVEREQPEQFAGAVIRLLQDRELREAMGEEGKRRVAERFDVRIQTQKVEQVYQSLTDGRNRLQR